MTLIVRGEPCEFGRDKALVVATERPNGAKAHHSSYTHQSADHSAPWGFWIMA